MSVRTGLQSRRRGADPAGIDAGDADIVLAAGQHPIEPAQVVGIAEAAATACGIALVALGRCPSGPIGSMGRSSMTSWPKRPGLADPAVEAVAVRAERERHFRGQLVDGRGGLAVQQAEAETTMAMRGRGSLISKGLAKRCQAGASATDQIARLELGVVEGFLAGRCRRMVAAAGAGGVGKDGRWRGGRDEPGSAPSPAGSTAAVDGLPDDGRLGLRARLKWRRDWPGNR